MTQVTAQPPSQLQKASEEITDSPKSKWKKHLLRLGLATGLLAAGAYQWGIGKTLAVLMVSEFGLVLADAAWTKLINRFGVRTAAEKKEADDACVKGLKRAAAVLGSSIAVVSFMDVYLHLVDFAQWTHGKDNVIVQARSGVDKPRACQVVMGWDMADFLPHTRQVCISASVERDGNFMIISPCREKKDGSCEPLSDNPIIYRGNELISNGGALKM